MSRVTVRIRGGVGMQTQVRLIAESRSPSGPARFRGLWPWAGGGQWGSERELPRLSQCGGYLVKVTQCDLGSQLFPERKPGWETHCLESDVYLC